MDIWADDPWAEAEPADKPATTGSIERPLPGWLTDDQSEGIPNHETFGDVAPASNPPAPWAFGDEAGWGEDDEFGTFESHTEDVDIHSDQDPYLNTFGEALDKNARYDDHECDAANRSGQTTSVVTDGALSDSGSTITPSALDATISPEKAIDLTDVPSPPSSGHEDTSSRPSTSPSPTLSNFSHVEDVQVDSPRTSFEADTASVAHAKDGALDGLGLNPSEETENETSLSRRNAPNEQVVDENEFADIPDELLRSISNAPSHVLQASSADSEAVTRGDGVVSSPLGPSSSHIPSNIQITTNFDAAKTLFSETAASTDLQEAHESSIWSTRSRKAWYRVTRRQTMRQYNLGKDENDYVRVRWKGSGIQSEVNKIVSRWSTADRFPGGGSLGGRPASMFGWEEKPISTPAVSQRANVDSPLTDTFAHDSAARSMPSLTGRKPPSTAKAKAAPVTASPVAQFGWSTTASAKRVSPPIPERTSSKQQSRASSVSPATVQTNGQPPKQMTKPLIPTQTLTAPRALPLSQPVAAPASAPISAITASGGLGAEESLVFASSPSPESWSADARLSAPSTNATEAAALTAPLYTGSWLDADFSIFETARPVGDPDKARIPNRENTLDDKQPEFALSNERNDSILKFATVAPPMRLMGPIPLGVQQPAASDDGTKVLEILRDIPDLSYMLR